MGQTERKTDQRRVDPKTVKCLQKKTVRIRNKAVTESIHCALKLNKEFLSTKAETWDSRNGYKAAKEKVVALRVVNDCAEGAVKLATDFNLALTHDEEQHQFIFQVVENYRQNMAVPLKKNLKSMSKLSNYM